ncbi:polyprotein, partial [Twisted-stalk chlorotic streak virus]
STVVDNTLMVLLAMYYVFSETGLTHDTCKFFANGDDLIIAVEPSMASKLDVFQGLFASLGLNYDFSNRATDKKDLWFMSHCAMEVEGILIPKLEPERIVSILEWDRSHEPAHRLEAICASMIEAWGYNQLLHEIRRFYAWVLEQTPYKQLAEEGRAPYLAETALKKLYLNVTATAEELEKYSFSLAEDYEVSGLLDEVEFQDDTLDAGREQSRSKKEPAPPPEPTQGAETSEADRTDTSTRRRDRDVDAGTIGTFTVPRLQNKAMKLKLPMVAGKSAVNLEHLLTYKPAQVDISKTRATKAQFANWFKAIQEECEVDESGMQIILNGFMVWCIENGTSPNSNGTWTIMDGEEQIEYPLKPFIENAHPTLRQVMAHFSDLAEAYIEMRNRTEVYMPRYGRQRNLRDMSLARCAFDFYEITSKTPTRFVEAHFQMKAAALRGSDSRLFGLDGNVGTKEEDTERHTTEDVNRSMHTLLGVRQ